MSTLASDKQPPIASLAATGSEAGVAFFRVWRFPIAVPDLPADDPLLRRYWVAAIGAGAVEDLLRLNHAANERRAIRRPLFLAPLMRVGLASVNRDVIWVASRLPLLPREVVDGLPHALRASYAGWRRIRSS